MTTELPGEPMLDRKTFLKRAGAATGAMMTGAGTFLYPGRSDRIIERLNRMSGGPEEAADDEGLWTEVQQAFTVDRSLVNLNNGGVSPAPAMVQDAMKRDLDYSNEAPVYTMWRILEPQREGVRQRLARSFGCDTEEIALTRNASEGLQICQFGIDLEEGDEVLTTNQDYPRMITTFRQRERREGIRLKQFSIPVPAEDDDEIVRLFEENITGRTRMILMSHIINITGQILPVRKVVQMARRWGIPVIVDGAHAYAHFDFKLDDLDCDFYATSLHKWLLAPHGTGMLFVRRERIRELWPLMAAPDVMDDDIRKFEEIGTHPAANYLAIAEALTFHQAIGGPRKEARLRYLTDYWMNALEDHPAIRFHTSRMPEYYCAIGNVEIEGVEPGALVSHLWQSHRIIVTPIVHDEFRGIRVTPNVYSTLEELDRFVDAMLQVADNGLPDRS